MSLPAFIPIDGSAKSGRFLLLRDRRGHKHSGHWDRSRLAFTYACGRPIEEQVTHYASRRA